MTDIMRAVRRKGKWFVEYSECLTGPFATKEQADAWIDAVALGTFGLSGDSYDLAVRSILLKATGE